MIGRTVAVAVPTSVSAGAGSVVSDMGPKTVSLTGTFTATYQLQLSTDGTNWFNEGSPLTSAGRVFVEAPCVQVRWNCTAYTSGTPASAVFGIYDVRSS